MSLIVNGEELWKYITIPFIAGVVGWFTNALALRMMFYPIEYKGINWIRWKDQPIGLFGWQGVVPTKVEKMASITFDLMTTKLLDVKEIFARLEPAKFSEVMEQGLLLMIDSIINETANEYMPKAWNRLPSEVRDEIVIMSDTKSHTFLTSFMSDFQEHITDILDLKEMTVSACVKNKPLMVRVFQEAGEREFVVIRRSGLYFGFLFGLLQMAVWFVYKGNWILPVFGFLVGWLTNWLALKLIFSPVKPRKICCFTLQGSFLKRQHEVSETLARIACVEVLHTKAMWESIFNGPQNHNFFAMLRAHTLVFTENLVGELKPIAIAALGAQRFAQMKEHIANQVVDKLPTIIDQSYEYTNEALDLERTMREKLQGVSPEQFEGVLHPVFQEDEIKLIITGGVLGLIVGVLQLRLLF